MFAAFRGVTQRPASFFLSHAASMLGSKNGEDQLLLYEEGDDASKYATYANMVLHVSEENLVRRLAVTVLLYR